MINIIIQQPTISLKIASAFALVLAAVFAIMTHELAHGYVAYRCGDSTAKLMGRLSFNPAKHFDIFGLIMMIVVGFGWAKPVPVNPSNFKNYKRDSFLVSIAGIVSNLILTVVFFGLTILFFWILSLCGGFSEVEAMYGFQSFFEYFFLYSVMLNISLMVFNLLPIYPLDGFRMIEAYAKPGNQVVAFIRQYGMYLLLALMIISYFVFDIVGLLIGSVQNGVLSLINLIVGKIV